jgi:hypothetical protein
MLTRKIQASDPEEFEHWEKLVRAAEAQEGGLNRNSSPQAIASTREAYDRFLARYPLFYGFWKRYADLEFAIAGTEAAEMVSTTCLEYTKHELTRARSTSAVSLALAFPSTSGPTTAASRSRRTTNPT